MGLPAINWFAVLVCVVAAMVIGGAWFGPKTFFPFWWKVVGGADRKPGGSNMALLWSMTVVAAAVRAIGMALVLLWISSRSGGMDAPGGMLVAFILWLFFLAPATLVNRLFAGHGVRIWLIETGAHLVDLLVMGAILGGWR